MTTVLNVVLSTSPESLKDCAKLLETPLRQTFDAITAAETLETVKAELNILVSTFISHNVDTKIDTIDSGNDAKSVSTLDDNKREFISASFRYSSLLRLTMDYFIASEFTTKWMPLMTSFDRESLVEPFFLVCSPSAALLCLAQNLGSTNGNQPKGSVDEENDNERILSSRLLAQEKLNQIANEQAVRVIVELLGKFFDTSPEPSTFRRCVREVGLLADVQRRSRTWSEILVILGSLPDRVANLMRRQTPSQFSPTNFFSVLTRDCLAVIGDLADGTSVDTPQAPITQLSLISQLFSKLCMVGRASCVSGALVAQLLRRYNDSEIDPEHQSWLQSLQIVIKDLSTTAFEPFFDALLHRLDGVTCSKPILRDLAGPLLSSKNATCTYLFTSKFITTRALPYNVIHALVQVLHESLSEEKFLTSIGTISDVWGSSSFIKNASFPLQNRTVLIERLFPERTQTPVGAFSHESSHVGVTAFIMSGLKFVSKDNLEYSNLMMKLIHGVHVRMENPLNAVRRLGMMIAEKFSSIVQPNEPIKFEYEKDVEDDLINDAHVASPEKKDQQQSLNKPMEKAKAVNRTRPTKQNIDPDALFIPNDDSDSENETSFQSVDTSDGKSDAAGEEDDFYAGIPKATALDDDVSDLNKVKRPNYLREVASLLRSDDPESHETALLAIEGLIRANPDDLVEVCFHLSSCLLHLSNDYEILNFVSLRQSASAAIVALCPKKMFPWMCTELFADNWSLQHRCDIIDIILAASTELAGATMPRSDHEEPPKIQEIASGDKSELLSVAKTRRWGSARRVTTPKSTQNRFAPFAPLVITCLLDQYRELRSNASKTTAKAILHEPIVFSKFVWTLGELIHLAGVSCPDIARLSKIVLEFLWAQRYTHAVVVRRALLLGLRSLIVAVPEYLIASDPSLLNELNEIVLWVKEATSSDEDEECRKVATLCLIAFSKKIAAV